MNPVLHPSARRAAALSIVRSLAVGLALVAVASGVAAEGEDLRPQERLEAAEMDGARTWERVWYREGANARLKPYTGNGDLILWDDAIEFVHKRKGWRLAFDDIEAIEFGKMRGDRDVDWVLLIAPGSEIGPDVALRDGGSFGFGRQSLELFVALHDALKAAGAAQWRVPPGREPFDGLSHQIRFSTASGWKVLAGETEFRDGINRAGTAEIVPEIGPGIRFDRREGESRDRCEGLSEATTWALAGEASSSPAFLDGAVASDGLDVATIAIGGCTGVRVTGRAAGRRVEIRAVQHRGTLFVFSVAGEETEVGPALQELDALTATVAFPVLRRFDDD